MKPRAFITGGRGMVGQNLIESKAAAGWDILAPSRAELDLLDPGAVSDYVTANRPNVIIHAAGKVGGIHANIAHPAQFLADNVRLGLNVIEAGAGLPGCQVLNLASSCIYPPTAPNPLIESSILSAAPEATNEGYALAKIAVLRFGGYTNKELGETRVKSLIPCNLYGRHDNFSPERSHLVPAIIAKLHQAKAEGSPTVTIWGDGSARREFALASDVASWIWDAAARFDNLPELLNIGIGQDHTVLDYYQAAAEVVGWTGQFEFDLERPVGMARKLLSVDTQIDLGFAPSTPLLDGLREADAFYRQELSH